MVTGEPIPVEKSKGSKVTGGTVNGTGSVVMEAQRVGSETLLAQIVRMVSEAQRTRAPIQRLADIVSAYFVFAVLVVAALTFVVWALFGPEPRMAYRHRQRRCRADHCLSLRAGLGDADVDHGRRRPRRDRRRPDQKCRGSGDPGESRTRWLSTRPVH